jgi:hypothetical protein
MRTPQNKLVNALSINDPDPSFSGGVHFDTAARYLPRGQQLVEKRPAEPTVLDCIGAATTLDRKRANSSSVDLTRERLLDAAAQTFSIDGLRGATTRIRSHRC